MVTKPCHVCGKPVTREPVILFVREMFAGARVACNDCYDAQEGKRASTIQEAAELEAKAQWLRICPERFRDTDLDRVPNREAAEKVVSWNYGPQGLLVFGKTGLCKTRCIFKLLERLHFKERRSIVVVNGPEFGLTISSSFFKDQVAAQEYVTKLIRADVLYLDDLDKLKVTDRVEAELYHIVNARTSRNRPILVSVNLVGDALADTMSENRGEPIVRRLRDYCTPVGFNQPNDHNAEPRNMV